MKITINQLRQIIKEEISRSVLMKESPYDAAWENFMTGLLDATNGKPSQGMLGKLLYNHFDNLVSAFPNKPELKALRSELSDVLNDNPSPEEQMEIIDGLEDRVRDALGFEGPGY
jgi:hypothetical protein